MSYLFEANGIGLGITVFSQVKLFVQLLGQMPMATFSKQSDFSVELHASFKYVLKKEKKQDYTWHRNLSQYTDMLYYIFCIYFCILEI